MARPHRRLRAAPRGAIRRGVALVSLFLLIALGLLWNAPGHATRIRPLNIEDLTRKAARIVSGRCVAVEVVEDADLGRAVTRVTIEVARSLKGPTASAVTFRMLGGAAPLGSGTAPAGLPRFEPGEEVILFLYGESGIGLTSPVGLGQGKFVRFRDPKGESLAINGFGNRTLFRELSPETAARVDRFIPEGKREQAVPAERLIDLIESLASESRR